MPGLSCTPAAYHSLAMVLQRSFSGSSSSLRAAAMPTLGLGESSMRGKACRLTELTAADTWASVDSGEGWAEVRMAAREDGGVASVAMRPAMAMR